MIFFKFIITEFQLRIQSRDVNSELWDLCLSLSHVSKFTSCNSDYSLRIARNVTKILNCESHNCLFLCGWIRLPYIADCYYYCISKFYVSDCQDSMHVCMCVCVCLLFYLLVCLFIYLLELSILMLCSQCYCHSFLPWLNSHYCTFEPLCNLMDIPIFGKSADLCEV